MTGVGSILLQDQRSALARRVEQAADKGGVVAAFAWYWLPTTPSVNINIEPILLQAVSAKGASRTFREVAVLGYALASGRNEPLVTAAFAAGLQQLAGRDFSIAGMHAPVCDDCLALLGLALGFNAFAADSKLKTWLTEACRIGATRQNVGRCDEAITQLATEIISGVPSTSLPYPSLLLASRSRGLLPSDGFPDSTALEFLKAFPAETIRTDEQAVLSLSALEWLLQAAPTIDLRSPSIQAVLEILGRTNASLHRWVFEQQAKTKGALPRQWHIDNEYHVQSLLWAVLAPVFPDLKEEEWLASIGQKKPRADLSLSGLRLIIEVKFWRVGTKVQDLIEEVAADNSLYLANGSPYTSIIVFIWDDTASTDQYHVLAQGLRTLSGVIDVVIQSRPSRFGVSASVAKKMAINA
jgi:hypothetical protein